MDYMILSDDGNAAGAYDDFETAASALRLMAESDPTARSEYSIIEFDDEGLATGETATLADLDGEIHVTFANIATTLNIRVPERFAAPLRGHQYSLQRSAFLMYCGQLQLETEMDYRIVGLTTEAQGVVLVDSDSTRLVAS